MKHCVVVITMFFHSYLDPSQHTVIYFSVESSPKTKRKCADDREYPDECHDVIFGQMSMLACYCQEPFCNSSNLVFQKNNIPKLSPVRKIGRVLQNVYNIL